MATITVKCGNVDQGTGDIRATIDACHIEVADLELNNEDGTQKLYRFRMTPADSTVVGSGYSELFAPSAVDGKHQWEGFIFPEAGSITLRVHDEEEDSDVATLAVTVVDPNEE